MPCSASETYPAARASAASPILDLTNSEAASKPKNGTKTM
jgi:hypothetical protein